MDFKIYCHFNDAIIQPMDKLITYTLIKQICIFILLPVFWFCFCRCPDTYWNNVVHFIHKLCLRSYDGKSYRFSNINNNYGGVILFAMCLFSSLSQNAVVILYCNTQTFNSGIFQFIILQF